MPADRISLEKAKPNKLFYFVPNALVYRDDGRFLILKRSDTEPAHPGKYATPGGKLEWEDFDVTKPTRRNGDVLDFEGALEDLLRREVREEAGIEIGDEFTYLNSLVFVRPDGIPVVLMKFAVPYRSGEVVIEEGAFTDYAWVNEEEVTQYDCVMGIKEEILLAKKLLKLG